MYNTCEYIDIPEILGGQRVAAEPTKRCCIIEQGEDRRMTEWSIVARGLLVNQTPEQVTARQRQLSEVEV